MGSSVLKKINNEDEKKKADAIEAEKRVYQVSLMLRRKPVSYILQYTADNWKIGARQTRTYISRARAEWKKYFEKLKGDGVAYHIAQNRDLKDQAYSRKVVVGTIDNKQVINVPDLGLILDITKEEAKLMGIYPAEKHKVEVEGELKVTDARRKLIDKINKIVERKENKE